MNNIHILPFIIPFLYNQRLRGKLYGTHRLLLILLLHFPHAIPHTQFQLKHSPHSHPNSRLTSLSTTVISNSSPSPLPVPKNPTIPSLSILASSLTCPSSPSIPISSSLSHSLLFLSHPSLKNLRSLTSSPTTIPPTPPLKAFDFAISPSSFQHAALR